MAAPAPAARFDWAQVAAWRAARHHLDERAPAGAMLEVAAGIAGVHAQVLSSAELTLWARVEGLAPDAVRRALWSERSLVKTWAMRGTRVGELTTPALGGKLRESWGALLKPAAALGLLCFAPGQGQQVRFTRPDTWLGGPAAGAPGRGGGQGRGRGHGRLRPGRRRGRPGRGRARRPEDRPAAPGLRPVRGHGHPPGRAAGAGAVQGPRLPAPGLAVAGAAGRRAHGRASGARRPRAAGCW